MEEKDFLRESERKSVDGNRSAEEIRAKMMPAVKVIAAAAALFFGLAGLRVIVPPFPGETKPAATEPARAEQVPETAGERPTLGEYIRDLDNRLAILETSPEYEFRFVDMDRLMKESEPGKAVLEYRTEYERAVDAAVDEIDRRLGKAGEKNAVRAGLDEERSRLLSRREQALESTSRLFRQLVDKMLADKPLGNRVVLLDRAAALTVPAGLDMTEDLASRMAYIRPQMPAVPEFKVPDPEPETVTAEAPKAKAPQVKSAPARGSQGKGSKKPARKK